MRFSIPITNLMTQMSPTSPISVDVAHDIAHVVAHDDAAPAEDSLLANSLSNGMNEAAFQSFYERTGPMLRGYIRRASGDAALADDIFQDAILRFLKTCPAGLDDRQQKSYLYRTATSLLVDHWRRAKRERLWGLKTLFEDRAHDKPAMGKDMNRLFAQLKPQEQALLWLAYVEGFEHREIASALELRERSVRVLLFRARKKMAGILTDVGLGPQGD